MTNLAYLIGRLTENPTMKEEGEKKITTITLAVQRSYKNEEGIYETDFINCILWRIIANNVIEYCKKGDLIGIKGSLQTIDNQLVVVAEKVSFLSTKKSEED